ncbi:2-methylcitrate dehydratase, partial [Lachnellula suecica]
VTIFPIILVARQHSPPATQSSFPEATMAQSKAEGLSSGLSGQVYDQVLVDIKDFVYHYKPTSKVAWGRARLALLDALGCAIESIHSSAECRSMLGPVVPNTTVPNGFKLPGTYYQLDPIKGAFDLGTAIRYLDHNDALGGAEWGHPSDNIGALLAVSDWLCRTSAKGLLTDHKGPPLTVRTLLEATIKAYEIQGCFQICNSFNAFGLDHTILVKLASIAVVSWLLGLNETMAMNGLSQVWMDSAPLRTFRSAPNTISRKGWAAGDACMRAVHLALLTRSGQAGAPTVLTAARWGFYDSTWRGKQFSLPKPYGTWVIENVFFKVIPAEGHGISAIEAALQLSSIMQKQGINPEHDIKTVRVRTHAAALTIISKAGDLQNAADRDHCIEYMIAVSLLKGSAIEAEDYWDESPWATARSVSILRSKIELREDPEYTEDYLNPNKKYAANGLTIELQDGSELQEVVIKFPVGHVENEHTLTSVEQKFMKNMGLMFSPLEIDKILKAVENETTPISSLVDLLVPGKQSEGNSKL